MWGIAKTKLDPLRQNGLVMVMVAMAVCRKRKRMMFAREADSHARQSDAANMDHAKPTSDMSACMWSDDAGVRQSADHGDNDNGGGAGEGHVFPMSSFIRESGT